MDIQYIKACDIRTGDTFVWRSYDAGLINNEFDCRSIVYCTNAIEIEEIENEHLLIKGKTTVPPNYNIIMKDVPNTNPNHNKNNSICLPRNWSVLLIDRKRNV